MKYLLGEKQNMTQIFTEEGVAVPVTVLSTEPIVVTQIKNNERDGYEAVQVGYGKKSAQKVSKAVKGHIKEHAPFLHMQEFRGVTDGVEVGGTLDISQFAEGDMVTVQSTSKGKGFQGVVKRHGFAGGRRSHGQKHSEREPGSIGIGGVQRVFKGTRMAGRMGGDTVTLKRVKVLSVNKDTGEMMIKGAVPGRRGTLVRVVG